MISNKMIFKKPIKNIEEKKALEKLIKDTYCGKQSVIGCPYYDKIWCEKNCGFYTKKINELKYRK